MCRIAGIVQLNAINSSDEVAQRLQNTLPLLANGGPDDAGVYHDEDQVFLGHRRLAIIDTSSQGHQPMWSADQQVVVTYNGELYNYLELRSELKEAGYTFHTNSDTEVLIVAYQHWGEEAFKRFNGMYAFGLHDKKRKVFYLVRDHAGIKPVYYHLNANELIFASEVKAFEKLAPEIEESPHWRTYFLLFGFIPQPYTTLKDVEALRKGSFLKLDLVSKKSEVQLHTAFQFTSDIRSFQEAVKEIRSTMEAAVKRHLLADAPLGVYLSGGIDSSLLALLAAPHKKDPLRTLSATFSEVDYDESIYQQLVSKKIRADHKDYRIGKEDFLSNLEDVFRAMDQPTVDGVNSYFIARCAKENGLKAVLSGIGADELFGGYSNFNRINKLGTLRLIPGGLLDLFKYLSSFKFKKLSYLSLDNPLGIYLMFRGIFTVHDTARLLDIDEKEVLEQIQSLSVPHDLLNIGKLNAVSYLESELYMTGQLLKDTDYMAMRHSVEVRVPFLDKEVMALAYRIKESAKFSPSQIKALLVEAFKDTLPTEIVNRKKQGFAFPFQLWLQGADLQNDQVNRRLNKIKYGQFSWSRYWTLAVMEKKGAQL